MYSTPFSIKEYCEILELLKFQKLLKMHRHSDAEKDVTIQQPQPSQIDLTNQMKKKQQMK